MHVVRRSARLRAAIAGIVSASLLSLTPSFVEATVFDNSDHNSQWFDNNDWDSNVIPTLSDAVTFPTPVVSSPTIVLNAGEVCASLTVNDNYTFTNSGGTLQVGSGSGFINVALNKNLIFSTALHADANALTFNGSGVFTPSIASGRTGPTTISDGVVRLNNAASLGSGTIHITTSGLLDIAGGLNTAMPISFEGGDGIRAIGGLAVIGQTVTVAPSATVDLFGGVLSSDELRVGNANPNVYTGGASATTVVKGPGTVLIESSNDYAGSWEIDTNGTLRLFNAGALGGNTVPVVIDNTGTLYLDNVTFNHNITLHSGATIATNNGGQSFGTATVDNNAAVTWAMHGTSLETVGLGANALTGGGGTSSISVTSDTAGAILGLTQNSDYVGSWSIGSNATVQIDRDVSLGTTTGAVAIAGGTLQTIGNFATSRAFNITGTSTLDVADTTTFTMSAGIGTGSGTTSKISGGTLVLQAASTRAGTVDVASGTLIAQHPGALGTSAVTVHAGTLTAANVTLPNNVTLFSGSTLRGTAGAGVSGNIAVDTNATVNIEAPNPSDLFTLNGAITGGGGTINLNGTGIILLSGSTANTATGLWQVNGGAVGLNKSPGGNLAISAGNVSIGDGTGTDILVDDVNEQIWNSANVNVFGGGIFNLNGCTETIGTVTMSSGSITGGSGGLLILNGPTNSGISVFAATASIACNINLGASAQRVFNIINGLPADDAIIDGVISGTAAVVKNNAGSLKYTGSSANTYTGLTTVSAGQLTLAKLASGTNAIAGDLQIGDGSGSDIVQLQQSEQIADTSNVTIASSGQLDLQTFTETINTLTMTSGQVSGVAGTLGINGTLTTNASATSATIASTVSLGNGTRTVSIADGAAVSDLTISGPVVSGTLNKIGAGKLTLGGATASPQNLTINLNAGSLDVTATQHLTALNVAANTTATVTASGTTVLYTNNLSVAGNGKLDISNNKAIVTAAGATGSFNGFAYTGITGLIQLGRNGNIAPLWDGSGIVTSQSNATAGNFTSIGVAKASDVRPATATATALWSGQTITGTDTLIMYTYGGDATLDGKINVDDYIRIDSGIAAGLTGWSNGDFNYDGKVNIDDYTQFIDVNIATQGAPFPTATGLGSVAAVPEPAVPLLILGGLAAMRRLRHNAKKRREIVIQPDAS